MMKHTIMLLLGVVILGIPGKTQTYDYSKVKIYTDVVGLQALQQAGVAIDHGQCKRGTYFISDFSKSDLEIIKGLGYKFDIIIADVVKYYRERAFESSQVKAALSSCGASNNSGELFTTPSNFNLGSMGGFYTYSEFIAHLDNMSTLYPNLITAKAPIGTFLSHEGEPIYWLRISDNPNADETEPEVLFTGIHHSREPASLSQLVMYMYYLLENYGTDPEVTFLVDNVEQYFIPMINPDGYKYNEQTDPNGGGMWRKNRRDNGGSMGVDLNRNYGYNWGYNNQGSSGTATSDTYRGPSAFSEPETQAIKYFSENHNILITLNNHTYGNLLSYPWGYEASLFTPDSAAYVEFSKVITEQNQFIAGTGDQILGYTTNGDTDDWMYGEQVTKEKIFSFTPESGNNNDGFWPQSNRIETICLSNLRMNLNTTWLVTKYATLEETSPSTFNVLSDYIKYDLLKLGLDSSATFTVSINNIDPLVASIGSPKVYVGMNHLEEVSDSIQFTLNGAIVAGQSFQIEVVVDNGYYQHRDTITKIYGQPIEAFTEDGSNLNNWIGNWGLVTTEFVSPANSVHDSPIGDYQNGETNTIEITNTIDLTTAISATLNFWAKWEIETGYDYAQVLASNDGGATWTALCGQYTVIGNTNQANNEPVYDNFQTDWVYEECDLNDYLGDQIRLKFHIASDNFVTEDGFYFDDLVVNTFENVALNIVNSVTEATCGNTDGVATISVTSGSSPYSYLWSNGATTMSATGLSAGIYSATVSDVNGVTSTIAIVNNSDGPTPLAIVSNILCFGNDDGSFGLGITGGSSPYTYNWSNTNTDPQISQLSAGYYSCTVSDNLGCVGMISSVVTEPPQLNINSTPTLLSGCYYTLEVEPSGGISPYNFLWETGNISPITDSCYLGNTYSVTVTDANGCESVFVQSGGGCDNVNELYNMEEIQVFPNPNDGHFFARIMKENPNVISSVLFNALGQKVVFTRTQRTDQFIEIEVKDAKSGIYYLLLSDDNGASKTFKLMIWP